MTTLETLTRNLATLTLLATAACSDATGPEIDPIDEPQFAVVYDLDVTTRYIEILGSCDTNALGTASAGEFQYKVVVSGEGQEHTQASSGYNTVTGKNYQKAPGGEIDFTNRTFSWRALTPSSKITMRFWGAEWDGVVKDGRMKNRGNSEQVRFAVGRKKHDIGLGSDPDACGIRLHYYATWTERKIPVG